MASDAGEHYFSRSPAVPSRPRTVPFPSRFGGGELHTDRGTFSPDRLDLGTRVLLDVVPDPPDAGVLGDLGCGYGPLAVALATASPSARVVAVDVNERARALCTANAAERGLTNVEVVAPDRLPADLRFDVVWSNPPIRIGKQTLHELLAGWLGLLADDGVAYLVVQKNLGGESLADWLRAEGWSVGRFKAKKGYRVLEVRRAV